MKKTLLKSLFYLFVFSFLFSCKSNDNEDILKYTTDTTLGLARINLNNIANKIPIDKILKEKKNIKSDEKLILQLIKSPKESGINIEKPFYVIVDPGKSTSNPEIKAFFDIDDKTKFQKSMSEITKSKITIDKKDFIYIDGQIYGSIKGKNAIMIKEDNYNGYSYGNYRNSSIDSSNTKNSSKYNEQYFTDFWKRKGTSNKAIKEQVAESLVDDKDASCWINLASVASYVSQGYIETLAINKLIQDAGIGFDFDFKKGSAEMDTKTFFNAEMKKVVEKYYNKNKINYDLVKNIELHNAQSFSIGFFSLDLMKYLIKEAGFESTVNHYLASTNKNLEDLTSTFTGDYAFLEMKPNKDSLDYYNRNNATILGINPKKADNIGLIINGLGYDKKYLVVKDKVIFSDDNSIIYQFKNNKAAKNTNLKKQSSITSYSWADGKEYNNNDNRGADIKITQVVNETKEQKGNMASKTIFTLDKNDENALYYFIMNGSN